MPYYTYLISLTMITQQCWDLEPSARPTFEALRAELANRFPETLQATQSFHEDNDPDKMTLEEGDKIAVIDGRTDNYYWNGQNQRTFSIGLFPRSVTVPQRKRLPDDISKPLRNSLIHTGHGSIHQKSWGSPSFIVRSS